MNSEVNRIWFDGEDNPEPPERKVTVLMDIMRRHGKLKRNRELILQGTRLLVILNSQTVQPFGSHFMVKMQEMQQDAREVIDAKTQKMAEIKKRHQREEQDRRQK